MLATAGEGSEKEKGGGFGEEDEGNFVASSPCKGLVTKDGLPKVLGPSDGLRAPKELGGAGLVVVAPAVGFA